MFKQSKYVKISALVLCLLIVECVQAQKVSNWYLPQALTSDNATITFDLDSTWHEIHGTVQKVQGQVQLLNEEDPTSVKVDVIIPTLALDTDSSSRDEKMRKVLAAETFPSIRFSAQQLIELCTPAKVFATGKCQDSLKGSLTIRDVTKLIDLPVQISKYKDGFQINGSVVVLWRDFNVEDPSILIAKIAEEVQVKFSINLLPPAVKEQ